MATTVTFQTTHAKILATITRDEATPQEVSVYGFKKIITQKVQTIDITPYILPRLIVAPIVNMAGVGYESGEVERYEKTPHIMIGLQSFLSATPFLPSVAKPTSTLLSGLTKRVIARGDYDEMYVFVPLAADIRRYDVFYDGLWHLFDLETPDEPQHLGVVLSPDFATIIPAHVTEFKLRLGATEVAYRIKPKGLTAKRLCWLNQYGGFDYFTFDETMDMTAESTYETAYMNNGYSKSNITYEEQTTVRSGYVTENVARQVAYVMASPQVYLAEGTATSPTLTPVDIIDDSLQVYASDDIARVSVSYRAKMRVL